MNFLKVFLTFYLLIAYRLWWMLVPQTSPASVQLCSKAQPIKFEYNNQTAFLDWFMRYTDYKKGSDKWYRDDDGDVRFLVMDNIFRKRPGSQNFEEIIYHQQKLHTNFDSYIESRSLKDVQTWEFVPVGDAVIKTQYHGGADIMIKYTNDVTTNDETFYFQLKTVEAKFVANSVVSKALDGNQLPKFGERGCLKVNLKNPCDYIPKILFIVFTVEGVNQDDYYISWFADQGSFKITGKPRESSHELFYDTGFIWFDGFRRYYTYYSFRDEDLIIGGDFEFEFCGFEMINFNENQLKLEFYENYDMDKRTFVGKYGNFETSFNVDLGPLEFDILSQESVINNKKEFFWSSLVSKENITLIANTKIDLDLSSYESITSAVYIRLHYNDIDYVIEANKVVVDNKNKWRVALPIDIDLKIGFGFGIRIPLDQTPQSFDDPFIVNILSTKFLNMYELYLPVSGHTVGVYSSISNDQIGFPATISLKMDRFRFFTGTFDFELRLEHKLSIDKNKLNIKLNNNLLSETNGDYTINESNNSISMQAVDVKNSDIMYLNFSNLIVGPYDANSGFIYFDVTQNGKIIGHEKMNYQPKIIDFSLNRVARTRIAENEEFLIFEFSYNEPIVIDHWLQIAIPKKYKSIKTEKWYNDCDFVVDINAQNPGVFVTESSSSKIYKFKNPLIRTVPNKTYRLKIRVETDTLFSESEETYAFLYADWPSVSQLDNYNGEFNISNQRKANIVIECAPQCESCTKFNVCSSCVEPYQTNSSMNFCSV